jgi:hypothetical protein
LGPATPTSTIIPEYGYEHPIILPHVAIGFRGSFPNREVLIHWRGFNPADATWDKVLEFQANFSDFVIDDKDILNGEGMLRNGKPRQPYVGDVSPKNIRSNYLIRKCFH